MALGAYVCPNHKIWLWKWHKILTKWMNTRSWFSILDLAWKEFHVQLFHPCQNQQLSLFTFELLSFQNEVQWNLWKLHKLHDVWWCCKGTFLFSVWAQVIVWNMDEKFAQASHAFYQFVSICELKGALLFFMCLCKFFKKWGSLHKLHKAQRHSLGFWCVLAWRSPLICVWMIF
jgi:hypothetical protein